MPKTVFSALMQVPSAWLNKVFSHRHDGLDQDGSAPLEYAVTSGAANAYEITLTPALSQNIEGLSIRFKASSANTGAATLKIGAFAAIAIKKHNNKALHPGDIQAGQIVEVVYDGTYFQMISPSARGYRGVAARLTGDQSIPINQLTTVEWGSEEYDTDSMHAASGSTLVVPVGYTKVHVSAHIKWTNDSVGLRIVKIVHSSGAVVASDSKSANIESPVCVGANGLIVAGNDTFRVDVQHTAGGPISVLADESRFTMELIE